MRIILLIALIMSNNSFASSCLDTLFEMASFMRAIPAEKFYHDSSFYYSTGYQENIIRKYYWTNDKLDSIYENDKKSWRFSYDIDDLLMNGNENLILKRINLDTIIYSIEYYENGVLLDDSIEERHWDNGRQVTYYSNDEGISKIRSSMVIFSNDTIRQYDIKNGQNELASYVTIDAQNICKEYTADENLIKNYAFNHYDTGFEMIATDVGSQYPYYAYFKYFDNPLSISNRSAKIKSNSNRIDHYNLIGQVIEKLSPNIR